MISLYRIRDNGMTFVVNATSDTVSDLQRRGILVRENKQTQFYDQTHWFSVRDAQQQDEFRQLVISLYHPPRIDVLQFALPIQLDNRPAAYWRDYIKSEWAKALHIEKTSRKVVDDHLGLGGLYCSEGEEERADGEEIPRQTERERTKTIASAAE